ncbi:cysteine desulfurase IscS [Roseivirga ehrenbergii]|uniref:cysteine desulfurase n=1 Tax=Roseivirga ehrenbergii (strain DSM 102268 / JCM 13514 / KCTC 12282 / NCIMB 14502 / KMM 6017) TaxID=279360 RepID=A0A150XSG2_ROSEK|nr:cysteine desulfurase family protein [Roseivirga ehrenbergii]KYG81663.1 cysteine desulfurase IscS [Roseivirga ehrenbergii]TCL10838.1 cysteine desulfurase IscS [Roseivirga ehrenbergii]
MEDIIYLDHNSTTPLDPRVLEAMMPYLTNQYANASSNHIFGHEASQAVKKASNQIADLIHCQPNEIVYTSGATESINLAIKGVAESYIGKGNHIITVQTEHKAVLDVCEYLETKGFEVTYLPVQPDGLIRLENLNAAIKDTTILVSVMVANNETGVIQPIQEIAEITHNAGALFFTDATQAFGKIPLNVDKMGIDLMAFSGHKIYGPKGAGGLFVRSRRPNRVKLESQIHGGGHQGRKRSGTLNVPGIVGLGTAAELVRQEMAQNAKHTSELRNYLETELLKIPGTKVNGNRTHRLPNTTNIYFEGIDSDALMMGMPNIMVSNGSACTSALIESSHVLHAMGLMELEAFNCLRFGLGKLNILEHAQRTVTQLSKTCYSLNKLV